MTTFMHKYSLPGVLFRTYFTLAAALACACVPLQLTAADYYVSQTGDDANDGSQAAPFKTILHAVKAAGAGIMEKPLLEALADGKKPEAIPQGPGCTAELMERSLEFMVYPSLRLNHKL